MLTILKTLTLPVAGNGALTSDRLKARVIVAAGRRGDILRASFAGRTHTVRLARRARLGDAMAAVDAFSRPNT